MVVGRSRYMFCFCFFGTSQSSLLGSTDLGVDAQHSTAHAERVADFWGYNVGIMTVGNLVDYIKGRQCVGVVLASFWGQNTRDYMTSWQGKFKLDLGCENDAALLTYTFNKECLIYNES